MDDDKEVKKCESIILKYFKESSSNIIHLFDIAKYQEKRTEELRILMNERFIYLSILVILSFIFTKIGVTW